MFRALPRPVQAARTLRRSLVSTVLLNRSWEQETLATLRVEAKNRGLSTKGNKATIIARIQGHDEYSSTPSTPKNTPASSIRRASTDAPVFDARVSAPEAIPPPTGEKGIAPGIPPNPSFTCSTNSFLNISLPDLTKPDPIPPVQVPYVPDFWESSLPASNKAQVEEPLPKVLVVADANAHHNSALMETLLQVTDPVEVPANAEPSPKPAGGIVSDMLEDLGLGPWAETKKNWRKFFP